MTGALPCCIFISMETVNTYKYLLSIYKNMAKEFTLPTILQPYYLLANDHFESLLDEDRSNPPEIMMYSVSWEEVVAAFNALTHLSFFITDFSDNVMAEYKENKFLEPEESKNILQPYGTVIRKVKDDVHPYVTTSYEIKENFILNAKWRYVGITHHAIPVMTGRLEASVAGKDILIKNPPDLHFSRTHNYRLNQYAKWMLLRNFPSCVAEAMSDSHAPELSFRILPPAADADSKTSAPTYAIAFGLHARDKNEENYADYVDYRNGLLQVFFYFSLEFAL